MSKRYLMDRCRPTACPPASRKTPLGSPVVPTLVNQHIYIHIHSGRELTTGINNIQPICTLHRHGIRPNPPHPRTLHQSLPIPLPTALIRLIPPHLIPLPDNHLVGLEAALRNRPLDQRPVRHGPLVPLDAARGGHDGARACGFDALGEGFGREASEDGGVDGAEADDG